MQVSIEGFVFGKKNYFDTKFEVQNFKKEEKKKTKSCVVEGLKVNE